MIKVKTAIILFVCIAGVIGIAFLKYTYSEPGYFNTGLSLIVLITSFLKKDIYTYIFAFLAAAIILASPYASQEFLRSEVVAQQLLSLITMIVTMFVVLHIKKLHRRMEGERAQMNALFERATAGIILTNSAGEIVLVNPEAQRLFEYDLHEMTGKQIEILLPDWCLKANTTDQRGPDHYFLSGNIEYEKEACGLKKSGHKFPVDVRLNYYYRHNQQFVLAFITDISERKESEHKLVQQKDQLEKITRDMRLMNVDLENKVVERTLILQEALHELERSQQELNEALSKEKELNEIKSRFVSMASHEFRTPLSTVLSSAALISKYRLTDEQEKREKHVVRIKESVQHLNYLLEDFLNLGRLEEGRLFTQIVQFDVKEFLQEVFDEMKISLKLGQQLKLTFEGEDHFVTDKRLLKNILINLLGNAMKFSGENKVIDVSIENSGLKMLMQIKDEGIGIPKDDMPYLFSTFFRGKNAVNIQGTGLGLHIVKRYVDLLDGHITLSSELGEGTTFNIGLPNLAELVEAKDHNILTNSEGY